MPGEVDSAICRVGYHEILEPMALNADTYNAIGLHLVEARVVSPVKWHVGVSSSPSYVAAVIGQGRCDCGQ